MTDPKLGARGRASSCGLAVVLATLAGPTILTQLCIMSFGVVDMMMLGRLGVFELDAAALGHLWLWGTLIFGIGVTYGLDPIVARAHGRGDGPQLGLTLQRGLVVATITAIPLIGLGSLTEDVLLITGQAPELAAAAEDYVQTQVWSVLPLLWFYALRQYLQGRRLVAPALVVALLANLFNVLANAILIWGLELGSLSIPALGLRGAALATGSTRSFLALGLGAWISIRGLHRGAWTPWTRRAFAPAGLLEIVRYGLPTGLQYVFEIWAFQLSTLLAGTLGREQLAAHSIAFSLASLTCMVPLGISIAASTLVGSSIGAGEPACARRSVVLALAFVGVTTLGTSTILFAGRDLLPRLYTADLAVTTVAAAIIPIVAAFQIFDGVQIVCAGILRGLGETISAAIANAVAYYLFALPLAVYLVRVEGMGLGAIWWSLALGLALAAGALVTRVRERAPSTISDPVRATAAASR